MINKHNVQISSMDAMAPDLLAEYKSGRRKIVLVYHSKVFERVIRLLDATTIEIIDDELSAYLKPGEKVLVVLPSGGKQHYVLQCGAESVHVDRFRLEVLDPRFDPRLRPASPCQVKLYRVPDVVVMKMQAGALQLRRQTGEIEEDLLIEKDNGEVSGDYRKLLGDPPTNADLVDVSQGGMCVEISGDSGEIVKII